MSVRSTADDQRGEIRLLSQRALNRALLARQLLIQRTRMPVAETLEHLVGMQSQAPSPPFFGLWSRLEGFDPVELSQLMLDRAAVRIVVMRGTVHLVTARDALTLRPLIQPTLTRLLFNGSVYGKHLVDIDIDTVVAAGRAYLEEQPRPIADLRTFLAGQWPDRDAPSLAAAVHYLTPLVQIPPRGLWGRSGRPICATAEQWLGQPLDPNPSIDDIVLRYLRAFGPASVADVQAWSGLTRLRDVVERLRPQLMTFRDDRGRELFDLPDAPRPDPATPAPIRFIPEWDNLLLSHDNRTRVIADEHRRGLMTKNGIVPGTILVDGFVQAAWKLRTEKKTATLTITPFAPFTAAQRIEIEDEGERLLAFGAEQAETRDIVIATA